MSESLLICTDLDRTLLPNGPQPESPQARERFASLVSHPHVKLAYVSGRDQQRVRKAIHFYQLPQPDFVIGDVGTTLYQVDDIQHWSEIDRWIQQIDQDWHGRHRQHLIELIKVPELRLQEPTKQNRHKLSYYVPLKIDQARIIQKIQSRLQSESIRASLIWSIDEPNGIGLLDIVPASASKFHAIDFLMHHLDLNQSQCVFCGDSGNDMEVLISPLNAVLVANSSQAIQQQALEALAQQDQSDSLYIAQGGFMGMNGNYSAGMLEGIAHFFPDTEHLMNPQLAES